MTSRVFEIENEIDVHLQAIFNLQTEKRQLLKITKPISTEINLVFDDSERTVQWNEGCIKMGRKTFCLVKLLWKKNKHRATIAQIEKQVWNVGKKKKFFVKTHTIFSLIRRAQKLLENRHFPYKILTIKTRSTHEIKGYKLICAKVIKKRNKQKIKL